ncbi:MAG: hypothetical protein RBU37_21620 [Myxococcota bacterium]|nr:hypothetical protein [Myxococcota bacterium]
MTGHEPLGLGRHTQQQQEQVDETGQAPNRQELGGTGQAPNRQELGGTGQAPNRQELGGTGQAPNQQESRAPRQRTHTSLLLAAAGEPICSGQQGTDPASVCRARGAL